MRRVSAACWVTRASSTAWGRRRCCAPMISSKNTATASTCRTTTTAASARTTATTTARNRAVATLLATTTAAAAAAGASFHNSRGRNQTTQCLGKEEDQDEEEQEKEDALDDHIVNANTNGNRNDNDNKDSNDDGDDSWRIPEHCLEYDHYNGVTIHVQEGWMKPSTTSTSTASRSIDNEKVHEQTLLLDQKHTTSQSMERILRHQIHHWRTQGIRGVWLHVPHQYASVVPVACRCGFEFHQVVMDNHNNDDSNNNVLVLSQWLPPEMPSRLPSGPTHQVGVGCLVWHPCDDNNNNALGHERRLLVVQERTGPAAAWSLWKMPTGLLDPAEDVHEAAVRELHEETGLTARVDGILAVRQAHATPPLPPTATSSKVVGRKHSDLFFVCQLSLIRPDTQNSDGTTVAALPGDPASVSYWDQEPWTVCPTEIAAIRWMTVREYAAQSRWQSSPVYLELNQAILDAATAADGDSDDEDNNNINNGLLWKNYTLPLRFGWEGVTNALYKKGNKSSGNKNENHNNVDSHL